MGFGAVVVPNGLPDFYRHVESVDWVVGDIEQAVEGWRRLGFATSRIEEQTIAVTGPGGEASPLAVRLARGNLGGFQVVWIQPPAGRNLYRDVLSARGDGVLSINHRVADESGLAGELERLAAAGASVLGRADQRGSSPRQVVYLDTASGGKAVIGLVSEDSGSFPTAVDNGFRKSQYAFVVKKIEPVSKYWEKLGWPAMQVTHGALSDLRFRGEPGRFDQRLGWQRHGDVVYEWIEPIAGPTVYEEALSKHGEGFHHFAFDVPDMDAAIRFFEGRGLVCSQSGSWGEKGKPGSGRFAYIDTEPMGGVTIELLWNYQD